MEKIYTECKDDNQIWHLITGQYVNDIRNENVTRKNKHPMKYTM